MAIKTGLSAQGEGGSARGSVAANGELASDNITVKTNTKGGEEDSKIPADTVDVLLHVDELGEGGDTIVAQEVVAGIEC